MFVRVCGSLGLPKGESAMESCCRKRKRGGTGEHQQSNVTGFQEVPLPAWVDLSSPNDSPLPPGWEQCLDLQSGQMYFVNSATQTRVLDDPRRILFKELAAEQSIVQKGQSGVPLGLDLEKKPPYSETNAGMPSLSNGLMFFKDTPSPGNSICFNSNLNANMVASSPSLFMAATTNTNSNVVGANSNLNIAATACLQCNTFVMVSRQSPHCPNCKNLCNVDPSIALGKYQT